MNRVFDAAGPLPTGTTLLEASAGTGKTWTMAALVTRYIAEGRFRIEQVMLVTFSRAATQELRSRVYQRLASTLAVLRDVLAGPRPAKLDEVDALLSDAPSEELAARIDRLEAALGDIDRAVIATTHEFCARMLAELGLLVDHDETTRFVDDFSELVAEAVNDEYVRRWADAPHRPALSVAREIAQAAVAHPEAVIVPESETGAVDFARGVRKRVADRKRALGSYGFDDMVTRLVEALTDEVTGGRAAAMLADRFPLVLVDEFQDTDPLQWQILRTAFDRRSTMVLIGDPKQAIYAFRGADINAYQQAVLEASEVATLGVNHRSDSAVTDGIADLFGQANLGSAEQPILLPPIGSKHVGTRLDLGEKAGPERVWVRGLSLAEPTSVLQVRPIIDSDLVQLVKNLLDRATLAVGEQRRGLRASDIAVIVRRNAKASEVQQALQGAGIPAVFSGGDSVLASAAASDWQDVLDAIADPSTKSVAKAAITSLVGWTSLDLATRGDAARADLSAKFKALARVQAKTGVAGVFELLSVDHDIYRRVLGQPGGDRLLTDLRHVEQLLHEVADRQGLGSAGLAEWLRTRRAEAWANGNDDRTRRLETDLEAVQVMTVHKAKGLQFPVVLLPDAADLHEKQDGASNGRNDEHQAPIVLHWEGRRVLDVAADNEREARFKQAWAEEQAESLRTLYVAMTRAESLVVCWWAPTMYNTTASPLHRLLFNAEPPGTLPHPERNSVTALVVPQPGSHVWARNFNPPKPIRPESVEHPELGLAARPFTRRIDHTWRRTSYSGLTRDAHELPPAVIESDEIDEPVLDEPDEVTELPAPEPIGDRELPGVVSPMADLPGGVQFGSLVHAVLEHVDPKAADLPGEVLARVTRGLDRWPVRDLEPQALTDSLLGVLHTPLGALADGRRLADLPVSDRLAELDFELPLGSRAGLPGSVAQLAELFADDRLLEQTHPLAAYGPHLAASPSAGEVLSGFLTGSIDAVLRVGDASSRRYLVVDYKTNRLPARPGEPLRVTDYTAAAMTRAMIESHYPLQALLYSVALHRYLSWRLADYDPGRHLGGIGYLFVRGMTPDVEPPPGAAMPYGVFTWRPSAALIEAASEVLAGGAAT